MTKRFWESQLKDLTDIALDPLCSSKERYGRRPKALAAAPSGLQIGMVAQLGAFAGIGPHGWLSNYVFGFPITGKIDQSVTFPPTDKPVGPNPSTRDSLFISASGRFKVRATRPHQCAQTLWGDALTQSDAGWLAPPGSWAPLVAFSTNPLRRSIFLCDFL